MIDNKEDFSTENYKYFIDEVIKWESISTDNRI